MAFLADFVRLLRNDSAVRNLLSLAGDHIWNEAIFAGEASKAFF